MPLIPEPINRSSNSAPRIALFLSRIHKKKGLLDLISAWAQLRPPGWRLRVAGNDEARHLEEVKDLAGRLRILHEVDFVGPVPDQEKWSVYHAADLFVLPSYSENFGIVIAEALAAGLPVITTRETPWSEIKGIKCGWWIETGADSVAAALKMATACSSGELREMGQRGRELIRARYSWASVAKQMVSAYAGVLQSK